MTQAIHGTRRIVNVRLGTIEVPSCSPIHLEGQLMSSESIPGPAKAHARCTRTVSSRTTTASVCVACAGARRYCFRIRILQIGMEQCDRTQSLQCSSPSLRPAGRKSGSLLCPRVSSSDMGCAFHATLYGHYVPYRIVCRSRDTQAVLRDTQPVMP
jgi:hypothetical protein